jgi:H+-transporting ATPase
MTIAYDNTRIDPEPVRWQMNKVLSVSSVLGLLAVAETFGLLLIGWEWMKNPQWQQCMQLDKPHLQTMLFLQLVAGGHLMLFLTRTKRPFFMPPFPSLALFCAIVGTQLFAVLMCAFGWLVPALPWGLIGLVWVYNIVWMFIQDFIKVGVYHMIEDRAKHRQRYLKTVNQPLHPSGHTL